jgi:hypothetical protein
MACLEPELQMEMSRIISHHKLAGAGDESNHHPSMIANQ